MRNTLGLPIIIDALSSMQSANVWSMTAGSASASEAIPGGAKDYGVTVEKEVELFGVTAQVITAETGRGLRDYLSSKGFELPSNAGTLLDTYISDHYSFVVGWVSDYSQMISQQDLLGKERLLAMSVVFSTDKLYFPLKPTSVYGNDVIPIDVYVTGFATPELFGDLTTPGRVRATYYINDDPSHELERKFTHIRIDSPSYAFTDDLWIANSAPLDISLAETLYRLDYLWFILLLIGASCLTSLLVGNLLFIKKRLPQKSLLILGVLNCLTIFVFATAVMFWDFKNNKFKGKQDYKDGVSKRKRIVYLIGFIVLFAVLTYAMESAWGAIPQEGYLKYISNPYYY